MISLLDSGKLTRIRFEAWRGLGDDSVESGDSLPAIITPRDIYPPAVPVGLEIAIIPATPQTAAHIELAWAISPESDLAGYQVLPK